jgi:8-oxo-dGTP diphosphatase
MEESGWRIENLRLLRIKDYPDRPHEDRQNISFVYIADAVREMGKHDWETTELKWFALSALPPSNEIAFDHASDIELYQHSSPS